MLITLRVPIQLIFLLECGDVKIVNKLYNKKGKMANP